MLAPSVHSSFTKTLLHIERRKQKHWYQLQGNTHLFDRALSQMVRVTPSGDGNLIQTLPCEDALWSHFPLPRDSGKVVLFKAFDWMFHAGREGDAMPEKTSSVGQVARCLGISPKAIRYYESVGLLPALERSTNGYRRFRTLDVNRLRFIIRAKALGLTLKEIRTLTAVAEHGECQKITFELKEIVESKIQECNERIESLTEFRSSLEILSQHINADELNALPTEEAIHPPFSPTCTCLPESLTFPVTGRL